MISSVPNYYAPFSRNPLNAPTIRFGLDSLPILEARFNVAPNRKFSRHDSANQSSLCSRLKKPLEGLFTNLSLSNFNRYYETVGIRYVNDKLLSVRDQELSHCNL